jgi:hypothetical protein
MNIRETMIDFLSHTPKLGHYNDDITWLAEQTNIILNDFDDDKLGRIRDLYYAAHKDIAVWVEDNAETSDQAAWLLNEAMEELGNE